MNPRKVNFNEDKSQVMFGHVTDKDMSRGLKANTWYELPKAHEDFNDYKQAKDYQSAFLVDLALGKVSTNVLMQISYQYGIGRAKQWADKSAQLIALAQSIKADFVPPALRQAEAKEIINADATAKAKAKAEAEALAQAEAEAEPVGKTSSKAGRKAKKTVNA